MKVLIVAGGTGGHFYPGLAVAKELLAQGDHVHFVVRTQDKVIPWLEREKISFSTIRAGGFVRRFSPQLIGSFFKNIRGFSESFSILSQQKPDSILAMGGYLSFPVGLAAWIKKIPVVLHEQNSVPGLANLWLSRLARKVAVSFPESEKCFAGKAVVTGNPVRPEFYSLISRVEALRHWNLNPTKKTFLIFGGSLGAHRLNEWVSQALVGATTLQNSWQALHFTGEKDVQLVESIYNQTGFQAHVAAYCHEMPLAYAAVDMVICRSGASTLAEVLVTQKPTLFIPYPFATNQHQTSNAKILVQQGVAEMKEEKDLGVAQMKDWILNSVAPEKITEMQNNYKKLKLDFSLSARRIREVLIREVSS